jgi:hypothetical protein
MAQAAHSLTTPETRKLAVLMRMALTYADAAGAEPDAIKRLPRCQPIDHEVAKRCCDVLNLINPRCGLLSEWGNGLI